MGVSLNQKQDRKSLLGGMEQDREKAQRMCGLRQLNDQIDEERFRQTGFCSCKEKRNRERRTDELVGGSCTLIWSGQGLFTMQFDSCAGAPATWKG